MRVLPVSGVVLGLVLSTLPGFVSVLSAQSPLDVSDELLGLGTPRRPVPASPTAPGTLRPADPAAMAPLPAGRVASVDVPLLVLFHPRMAEYYEHVQTFIRPLPEGVGDEALRKLIVERRERAAGLRTEVRTNLGAVARSVKDVISRRSERRTAYYRTQTELRSARDLKVSGDSSGRAGYEREYMAAVDAANSTFWADMKALDEEQAALEGRRRALEEQLRRGEFLDSREREKILLGVEREILAEIRKVVTAGRYALVLNSGYLSSVGSSVTPPDMPSGDLSYFLTPYLEFLRDPRDLRDREARFHADQRVDQWLMRKGRVLPTTYGSSGLATFVLMGADDVTPQVLDAILDIYKVDKVRRAFLRKKLF
jgi:hypothetical protein